MVATQVKQVEFLDTDQINQVDQVVILMVAIPTLVIEAVTMIIVLKNSLGSKNLTKIKVTALGVIK